MSGSSTAIKPGHRSLDRARHREGEPALDGGNDDTALLMRTAAGDGEAFRRLVDRHLPSVLRLARRMLRDEAEAEDVGQEALLRLWRGANGIEVGTGGVGSWLYRVTSNLCIDRVRARKRLSGDEVPEGSEPAGQLRGLVERDLAREVEAALQALPERQRLALVLFHYQGLSQNEVAATMDITAEAVESLLARARRTLKGSLAAAWRELLPDSGDSV